MQLHLDCLLSKRSATKAISCSHVVLLPLTLTCKLQPPYLVPWGHHHLLRVGSPPAPLLFPLSAHSAARPTPPALAPPGACAAAGAGGKCGVSPATGRIKAKKLNGRFITNACWKTLGRLSNSCQTERGNRRDVESSGRQIVESSGQRVAVEDREWT